MNVIKIGFLFAESDKRLADEIRKQLVGMRRQGYIEMVGAPNGENRLTQGDLQTLNILLVMLSKDFVDSDFLVEMALLAQRHRGSYRIIPIVLRDVNWERDLPKIGSKQALPRNGKPIARQDVDSATAEIAHEIGLVVYEMLGIASD